MKSWKCTICGYVHEGNEPPKECPLCKAGAEKFIEVTPEKSAEAATTTEQSSSRRWKCSVCGYVHVGAEAPAKCPLCGVPAEKFNEVDANDNEIGKGTDDSSTSPKKKGAEKEPVKPPAPLGFIGRQILKHHLHPISVHFPNGVLPAAVVFLLITAQFQFAGFEVAAFFNLAFVLITMPVIMFSGYLEWQNRYNGALTWLFKVKILSSLVVITCLTWLVGWRIINPEVMAADSPVKWVYVSIAVVMVGAAGIAGHLGGKLVFGGRK